MSYPGQAAALTEELRVHALVIGDVMLTSGATARF